jgi:UDP-glucose 4-epimerase
MRRALVTGGSGLLGRPLVQALLAAGVEVVALSRRPAEIPGAIGLAWDLASPQPLPADALEGVDVIFHLASHTGSGGDGEQGAAHRLVTLGGSERLLQAAARHGVARLLFVSSVRAEAPQSDYGHAKRAAEQRLLAGDSPVPATILRLPALYGSPIRGNIARLLRLIDRGLLPPLPETGNRRSLVHLQDAVAALLTLAADPRAAARRYTLTDGETYSAARIDRAIRAALGRPPPRWIPPRRLWGAAAATGDRLGAWFGRELPLNSAVLDKLLGDAWYDGGALRQEIGFQPCWTLERALPEIVAAYRRGASTE